MMRVFRTLKQQGQQRDQAQTQSQRIGSIDHPIPVMRTKNHHYESPNFGNMPLKLRERSRNTKWPVNNRPLEMSELPPTRNVGRLFRRYANGKLAYDDVIAKVKWVIIKYNEGLIPLNEQDRVMLSAVFPEIQFQGLPKEIIQIKAPLSERERKVIHSRLPVFPRQ